MLAEVLDLEEVLLEEMAEAVEPLLVLEQVTLQQILVVAELAVTILAEVLEMVELELLL
jgi:hypothetical protein